MAEATISRWGNSEAVRIPRHLLQLAGFESGEKVLIEFDSVGSLTISHGHRQGDHRRVRPRRSVSFEELFRDYGGGRLENSNAWAGDTPEGAEREAWGL